MKSKPRLKYNYKAAADAEILKNTIKPKAKSFNCAVYNVKVHVCRMTSCKLFQRCHEGAKP